MLSTYLGEKVFLKGVARYLKKHAYGNATTEDLWAALSEESGKDVASFMRTWIKQIGFPVLDVTEDSGKVTIKQSRFLSTGDVKPEDDKTTWWVPLGLTAESVSSKTDISTLDKKEVTLEGIDLSYYKINNGQTGFYRVNYPAERLRALGKAHSKLSVSDKVGIIADAGATAFAGVGTTVGLLEFLKELKDEQNYMVWASITERLGKLKVCVTDSTCCIIDADLTSERFR